jgi:ubiquitin carboxyl-terminal hydrolase 9/13
VIDDASCVQFGNTCYCNSVLQALYHCVPFRQLIDSYPNPTPSTIPAGPTATEIAETFKAIEANGGKVPGYEHLYPDAQGSNAANGQGEETGETVEKTPNKARWSMGMGRKQSSAVLPTPTSPPPASRGNLTRLNTNGAGSGAAGAGEPASPLSPGATASTLPPTRQPTLSTPVPPRDPNLPPASVLSAVQSLFNYIDSSPPHPPPPPKPPQEKPPGAETTGGTTLFNPHNPDRPFVRGGGPHGAGTMGKGVVKPEELVRAVKRENELFRGNMHQDAHEFLGWMLNKIAEDVEELEKSMGREEREEREKRLGGLKRYGLGMGEGGGGKTLVHQLFEGLLTNETRCLTCETVSPGVAAGCLHIVPTLSFRMVLRRARPRRGTNLSSTFPSISSKTRPSPRV